MAAIRYFFSYARADAQFVLRLAQELRSVGANVWVDQLDIMAGQRWDHAVEEALKTCQGMIIVLSPHSVASINVMDEVSYALGKEKPIVPILLRPCEIPFRLQRLQQVDFTRDYDAGFTRLLRDLKIELPAPAEAPQPRRDPQVTQDLKEPDNAQRVSTAPQRRIVPDLAKQSFIVTHPRLIGALIGAIIGGVWAVSWSLPVVFIAIDGIVGAITGTTIGRDWRVLAVTIVAIVIGFTLWAIISSIPDAAIVGAPLGAIVGSFVGSFLKEQRGWP